MVPLFYVDDCLMLIPSKDKNDEAYASLQAHFKIEYYGQLNMYLVIYLDQHPDVSIHQRQNHITQSIISMIPGMYKSSAKPTPVVKPPLSKETRELRQEKMTLITNKSLGCSTY